MKNQNQKKSGSKQMIRRIIHFPTSIIIMLITVISFSAGCSKGDLLNESGVPTGESIDMYKLMNSNFEQVNLVSDADEYAPTFIDANLVNAWGLAFNDEGEAWVSSADAGMTTVYGADGVTLMPAIGIPFAGDPTGGEPTGVLYNLTSKFLIPATGEKSEFIYATENGTIVGAAAGIAYTLANRSAFGSIYKGIALAKNGTANYLYATDFHNGHIDVFSETFAFQDGFSFTDPEMPAGYAPFNIKLIDGRLYVTYAKQLAPENADDESGAGYGFVDVFNTNGTFVMRFASHGSLNSPWGIEQISGPQAAILIGNFGDGKISVFDSEGNFKSFLKDSGSPVVIEGLWSIVMPKENLPGVEHNRIYFTSGPDEESHGVFGYLMPVVL